MLLKSRKPGPRAKNIDLPVIVHGTIRTGLIYAGACTSYHFFRKDVEEIAKLVHGDVEAHMREKNNERCARKTKNRYERKRKLKVRYHTDCLAIAKTEKKEYHQHRMSIPELSGLN